MNPLVQLKKAIPLFLAALILGLMGLTQQTDSQSAARPLPNKDGGDPPPPGSGWGPCAEVTPGVWQQENGAGQTRPCSPKTPTPAPVPPRPAPFDLVWDTLDPNSLPSNPKWGYYVTRRPSDPVAPNPSQCPFVVFPSPGSTRPPIRVEHPSCTTQPVWWEPGGNLCDEHVNWQTVEYDGALFWDVNDGHSNPLLDDDYNFWLGVGLQATLTTTSPPALQLEFKAEETIDHFRSRWWEGFHAAVDNGGGTVVDTDYAIVIGLLGLDCYHPSCGTEIHPVYAMAIHDSTRRAPDDDVWAIFARNWGNEGFCSSGINTVGLTSIAFRIPWRSGATSVTVKPSTVRPGEDCRTADPASTQLCTNSDQTSWSWNTLSNNQGLLVRFNLPPPPEGGLFGAHINGELHLKWSGPRISDPCADIRNRLTALQNELNHLNTGIPADKAENPGLVEAAQRRIEQWHRANDQEVARLRQELADCQSRRGLGSSVAVRVAPPPETRTPESKLQEAFNKLPSKKRQAAIAQISQVKSTAEDRKTPVYRESRSGAIAVVSPERIRDAVTSSRVRSEDDRRRLKILCQAFDNSIPGFPDACR